MSVAYTNTQRKVDGLSMGKYNYVTAQQWFPGQQRGPAQEWEVMQWTINIHIVMEIASI